MDRYRIAAMLALGLLGGGGEIANAATPSAYTVLDDNATQLREDFNEAKGSVRLIFVVDPICPQCLRGLDDINAALLGKTNDARLQTFVVHVPVIGAEAKDVAPSAKLLHNSHVRHYWNESGAFGGLVSSAVDLRSNDGKWIYAWDVWLIYGPDAVWEGNTPPQPTLLMQQLSALKGNKRFPPLDRERFAQQARELLTNVKPTTSQE